MKGFCFGFATFSIFCPPFSDENSHWTDLFGCLYRYFEARSSDTDMSWISVLGKIDQKMRCVFSCVFRVFVRVVSCFFVVIWGPMTPGLCPWERAQNFPQNGAKDFFWDGQEPELWSFLCSHIFRLFLLRLIFCLGQFLTTRERFEPTH